MIILITLVINNQVYLCVINSANITPTTTSNYANNNDNKAIIIITFRYRMNQWECSVLELTEGWKSRAHSSVEHV